MNRKNKARQTVLYLLSDNGFIHASFEPLVHAITGQEAEYEDMLLVHPFMKFHLAMYGPEPPRPIDLLFAIEVALVSMGLDPQQVQPPQLS
jgi:hypothetical protein